MKSTFKILFILRNRLNKDGLATLTIRITIDGKRTEINSKIYIKPEDWDSNTQKLKGKSKYTQEVNDLLDIIKNRLYNGYWELYKENAYVTINNLKSTFLGYQENKYSLISLFNKKINQKKKLVSITIDEKTYGKYICTRNKVKSFITDFYGYDDINISEVNYDFVTNYEIFLKTKCRCGYNTVIRDLRYLKQITTNALRSGYIRFDPFNDIKLTSKKGNREYLTLSELNIIAGTKLRSQTLDNIRDIFIFCCMTGLAYKELHNLQYSDININKDGKKYIQKIRTKTGQKYYIPLLEVPELIIEKYKTNQESKDKIFPVKDCQSMNRLIQEVAICCGIRKHLSTHVRRHTFATLMLTVGVSIESISKMLGHIDIQTTQIYAKIINTKVDKEMDKVRDQFEELKTYFLK